MPKLTKFGNSTGVTLPAADLARAGLNVGDEMVVTPVQDGVLLTAADSARGRMLAAAMADMEARPAVYRKLAE